MNQPIDALKAKEFLSVKEASQLLGACRQTVYNLINSGVIKAVRLSPKKTIIRRVDIDQLFVSPDHLVIPQKQEEKEWDFSETYTMQEVQELYAISDKALYSLIKREGIPKRQEGARVVVPKSAIDNIFKPLV